MLFFLRHSFFRPSHKCLRLHARQRIQFGNQIAYGIAVVRENYRVFPARSNARGILLEQNHFRVLDFLFQKPLALRFYRGDARVFRQRKHCFSRDFPFLQPLEEGKQRLDALAFQQIDCMRYVQRLRRFAQQREEGGVALGHFQKLDAQEQKLLARNARLACDEATLVQPRQWAGKDFLQLLSQFHDFRRQVDELVENLDFLDELLHFLVFRGFYFNCIHAEVPADVSDFLALGRGTGRKREHHATRFLGFGAYRHVSVIAHRAVCLVENNQNKIPQRNPRRFQVVFNRLRRCTHNRSLRVFLFSFLGRLFARHHSRFFRRFYQIAHPVRLLQHQRLRRGEEKNLFFLSLQQMGYCEHCNERFSQRSGHYYKEPTRFKKLFGSAKLVIARFNSTRLQQAQVKHVGISARKY